MRVTLLLILLFSYGFAYTQDAAQLTGLLLQDGNGEPLPFATAVAYRSGDSTMVANATTDIDGSFALNVSPGSRGAVSGLR